MRCPQCQHENPEGALFCNACGTKLGATCPNCDHENPSGSRFCNACGHTLATDPQHEPQIAVSAAEPEPEPLSYTPQHLAEKILTSRSALEGERKQVTVMFADIKDSTELIRDLDPEAAQQLLDPAIHIMMDAVHRFEGTVNQVLGDGIMAIFGAPVAHEDHAARACYAALSMQAAMKPFADEIFRSHAVTMQIRVGLNSGEVVVRTIGNDLHMDYSAVGQTTHLASRMEQLATPGSITLTGATLRLVEGLMRVNTRGSVPVKGMTEPVEVHELTGASSIRRRLQAAVARGLTTFVGRDTEIEVLNQALEQAKAGNGQVVAAVGEAGLGKSRLFYEFIHSHRTQGCRVLESASVSYGKATPYFPVIDLLKRYAHIEDSDDGRTIRAKLTGQVLTLDETLHDITPALLALCDVLPDHHAFLQLDPPQRRQRTLNGLKRLLLCESQEQPLVLVFEDLHWIDSETQALLDSLVESLPTASLVLLVNCRPEYQHSWGSKTYYTQLRLDPLPPESAEVFLQALLGDDPSLKQLKPLLIERTQGNPFFLEETVRTLFETEGLVGEAGAYRLGQTLPSIQVPDTVQAILAARIDRLPSAEKQLLQTAAVIGTEIPLLLLQAITDMPDDALQKGLAHLQAAEFIYETQLFPERQYTFKHALTHEVAYGSLLQERRRALHVRIVRTLETLAGDRLVEHVEQLAHHALRGEVWDKAVTYYWQGGQKALPHSANREAVVCFEQALGALQHIPESRDAMVQGIDLRFELHRALLSLGEFEHMLGYLEEAECLADTINDQRRLAWVACYKTVCYYRTGDYEHAIACGRRALAIGTQEKDRTLHVAAQFCLGTAYSILTDYKRSIAFFTTIATSLEGDDRYEHFSLNVLPAAVCRSQLAWCFAARGDFGDAIAYAEEGLKIAQAADHQDSLVRIYNAFGHVYLHKGDFSKTIALLERSLSLSGEFPLLFPISAAGLGYAYAHCGRITEAVSLLEQAVERGAAMTVLSYHACWVAYLSEVYLMADRPQNAYDHARHALAHARKHKERGYAAYASRILGDIAMHPKPPDIEQAETRYQQALALANELGMRPLQAHCHRGLGTLYSQTGQSEQARVELSTAIDMYRDMGMTFWLPETEAALAVVEGKA